MAGEIARRDLALARWISATLPPGVAMANVATSVELGPTEGVDITSGDRSTARIQLQRVRIEDNLAIFQAQLRAYNMTDVRVSDSLIAGGSNDGALGYTFDSARIFLTNVTVADNAPMGLFRDGTPGDACSGSRP